MYEKWWDGWTRGFISVSVKPFRFNWRKHEVSKLKGSVGKLLGIDPTMKTAWESPRKWIRYNRLWNGTVSSALVSRWLLVVILIAIFRRCKSVSWEPYFFCSQLLWKLLFPDRFRKVILGLETCLLISVAGFRSVLKVFLGLSWPHKAWKMWFLGFLEILPPRPRF